MMPAHRYLLIPLLCAGPGFSGAWADHIRLKDGRILEGVVLERGDTTVTVQDGNAQIRIPADNIEKITPGTEGDHLLLRARAEFTDKRPGEGMVLLGEAASKEAQPEAVAALMLSYADEIAAAIPKAGAAARDGVRQALDAAKDAKLARQEDYLIARLRWFLALNDTEGVSGVMENLGQKYPRALQNQRADIIQWFGAKIDESLDANEFSRALDFLVELRRLDQGRAGEKRAEMVILWARRERDQGNYEKALRIYADQLFDLSPNIARDRISVTLEEAEKDYRAKNEPGRAIDLYEAFGLQYDPDRSRDRLVALWAEIGRGFLAKGDLAEARKIFTRSESLLKGSAARDLDRCDYTEMLAKLEPDDYVGHYSLGEWCVQRGMLAEARKAFETSSMSEVLRQNAFDQLKRITNAEAEAELKRLMDLYERGQYVQVLQGVTDFRSRPAGEGLIEQATRLEQLAHDAIQLSAAEHPQQAEVLMQQAERAFWTGDIQQSYNQLRALMDHYADTPAGARAAQFYRTIRSRLDLDTLERHRRSNEGVTRSDDEKSSGTKPEEGTTAIAEEIRRLRATMEAPRQSGAAAAAGKVPAKESREKTGAKTEDTPAVDLDAIPPDIKDKP